ncbi:hypothetical protein KEM55_001127, partial [Ascosphaera atra]
SLKALDKEVNINIDLDAEQGRTNSTGKNSFRLVVRPTKKVNLAVVEQYVKGNTTFTKDALEGL